MIFITLGSQKFQFNRLLKAVDELVAAGKIKDEVFAQIGYSDYKPMSMAKQDNYKKERTETALSFHFSDFGMRGYISMVKPSGLFLRFSFSFW